MPVVAAPNTRSAAELASARTPSESAAAGCGRGASAGAFAENGMCMGPNDGSVVSPCTRRCCAALAASWIFCVRVKAPE